jgi:hypothetical protein
MVRSISWLHNHIILTWFLNISSRDRHDFMLFLQVQIFQGKNIIMVWNQWDSGQLPHFYSDKEGKTVANCLAFLSTTMWSTYTEKKKNEDKQVRKSTIIMIQKTEKSGKFIKNISCEKFTHPKKNNLPITSQVDIPSYHIISQGDMY